MENASKALIMATGILIGLMIAALFAYEMISVSETGKVHQERIDHENILEFNSQFEKYAGKPLTAQEIATICNYVLEWNKNNETTSIEINFSDTSNEAIRNLKQICEYIDDPSHTNNPRYTIEIEEFIKASWNDDDNSNRNYTIIIDTDAYSQEEGRIKKITIRLYK